MVRWFAIAWHVLLLCIVLIVVWKMRKYKEGE